MNFYVLAKCIDSEKGDIIIDLTEKSIKTYKALYKLKEDVEYELEEDSLSHTDNFQWDIIKSYELAFGKVDDISRNGFRFISVSQKDNIRIDNNKLLYINDLFFGKFVNQKEVELLQKEGVSRFKAKLEYSKRDGIMLLVKGKKIYRIFTSSKFKTLRDNATYDQSLLDLVEERSNNDGKNQIEKVEADLKQALDLIRKAIDTLSQIKENKTL